jgi:hypothetical protein
MTILHVRRYTSRGPAAAVLGGLGLWLAACSPAQQARAVADGQLFCAKATTTGPLVVALADAAGAPVIVTGLSSDVVAAACRRISAIPVSPPADPAAAPVVAVAVPAAAEPGAVK